MYRAHHTYESYVQQPLKLSETQRIALQPGMTATAEIVTGESTVFNYLMKPILKTTSESLGER